MNPKAWTLVVVALSAGCTLPNSIKKVPYSSCSLSQQSAQKICMIGAQENKLLPERVQADGKSDITRFRFNYSITTPTGEIAAETFCEIDTARKSIVDAELLRVPASETAIDYLQKQELCSK